MESFQFTANHENNFRLWISKHFSELFLFFVNALFRQSEFHLSTNEAAAFLWEFFLSVSSLRTFGVVTRHIQGERVRKREKIKKQTKKRDDKPVYVKTNTKLESIR